MTRKQFSSAAIAACILTFALAFEISVSAQTPATVEAYYDTVFSRTLDGDFLHENADLTEIERVGPAAFDVTSEGNFAIADTPKH